MDLLDKSILLALDTNCRLSYQALAERLGITATAVRKRLDKLIEEHVIEEFDVILRPAMIESEYLIALIYTDGSENEEEFIPIIGTNVNVIQAGQIATSNGRLYFVHCEYTCTESLQNLGTFFRKLESVTNIELHTIITMRGSKFDIKKMHLRVLQCLLEDARMQISDISQRTGMTARRVSRAIQEMQESEAFWFATRWNLSLGNNTEFYLKVHYDEQISRRDEIEEWFQKEYPLEYWYSFYSALEPTLFAKFVTGHFRESESISKATKKASFCCSVDVLLSYPVVKFPRIGHARIKEMIEESGI
ncbi:MAG: winged helix-turn-helix transcriptional regulator [Candidatus Thorarchaeota archaeon]